jgi:putative FmdB family regulatory protein
VPLYEYKCEKCGNRFEKIESLSASSIKKCPKCGGKAERLLSPPAIQFKGTGWYVTDYAGKKSSGADSSGGDGAKSSETGSDKAAESKPGSSEKASKSEKTVPKKKK